MEKDDGRKLTALELKERRNQVIRAYKRGLNKKQISRDLGLSYPAVRNIIARYEEKGAESLAPGKKGRKERDGRALTEEQEAQIRRLICEKRLEQLKMEFALWNRGSVNSRGAQRTVREKQELHQMNQAAGNEYRARPI